METDDDILQVLEQVLDQLYCTKQTSYAIESDAFRQKIEAALQLLEQATADLVKVEPPYCKRCNQSGERCDCDLPF